ncbi:MAG: hypothetical protein M1819_005706, partial [Sarea resinae]
ICAKKAPAFFRAFKEKVATDNYDSDDALNLSPQLQPTRVKLQPSPSPPPPIPQPVQHITFENVSTRSSRRGKNRSNRVKTRPSLGDAVLLNFLGPGHPDVARQAAENPLNSESESESDAESSEMAVDVPHENSPTVNILHRPEASVSPAQIALGDAARDALRLVDAVQPMHPSPRTEAPENVLEDQSRKLPAQDNEREQAIRPANHEKPCSDHEDVPPGLPPNADGGAALSRLKDEPTDSAPKQAFIHESTTVLRPADSLATSPNLRQHRLPASKVSPQQTLPAISPSQSSSRSPIGELSLPSLQSITNQIPDVGKEAFGGQSNGVPARNRQSFSSSSGGPGQSPPGAPRSLSNQDGRLYMSTQPQPSLVTGQAQASQSPSQYSSSQATPISSRYSEQSPQDRYLPGRELPSRSPQSAASHAGASLPYYSRRRPSQVSDAGLPYNPLNATEQQYVPAAPPTQDGPSSISTNASETPSDRRMSIDFTTSGRPLQQQVTPGGGFKCDHPGCSAAPFQTQYLLKQVTDGPGLSNVSDRS